MTPEQSLACLVAQQPIGSRIPLEIIRNGRRLTATVAIAERPSEDELRRLSGVAPSENMTEESKDEPETSGQNATRQGLGVSVQSLTPEIARRLQLPADARGLVVVSIDPNSDAARLLQPGDLIMSIDRALTPTPEAAASAVDAARRAGRDTVLLLVRRGNIQPIYIGVELSRR